jgi:hypothetical protein
MNSPTDFQPTPAQRRFLERAIDSPWLVSTADYCQAAGTDAASYGRWMRDPAFRQWFFHHWSTSLLADGWQLLNLALSRADRDEPAFQLLFNLLFEPAGQAALARWRHLAAPAAPVEPAEPSATTDPGSSSLPN